jgi:hypothetical protein
MVELVGTASGHSNGILEYSETTHAVLESEYWTNYRVQVDWQVASEWNERLRVLWDFLS